MFKSPIGPTLFRDKNVCQWIISGLQQSSNPEYESLNLLAIDIIHCALQKDEDVEYWIVHNESSLFLWSLSLISSPFEASFQKLEKIINEQCGHPLLRQTMFSENVIGMLLNVKEQNENDSVNQTDRNTIRFRAHALWIGTMSHFYGSSSSKQSDEMKEDMIDILTLYVDNGLMDDLLGLLQGDDVLIQINVLPLLSSFADFENGLKLLLRQNIISLLHQLLQSEEALLFGKEIFKVLVSMMISAKTLGLIGQWVTDKVLFQILENGFNLKESTVQESCCLFVGHFVSIPKILNMIIAIGDGGKSSPTLTLCKLVVESTKSPSSESKAVAVAAVHGICEILNVENEQKEVVQFQKGLLQQIGGMDAVYGFLKVPEDEMRFAVFRVIQTLCAKRWGLEVVLRCGGLFEYLTDRNEADVMAGYRWRYAICEQMFRNKRSGVILNQTQREQLQQYIEEGVVFRDEKDPQNGGKRAENVVQLGWEQR